ncbi:MAG: hypothetical protein WBH31_07355 [Promethearchaeia archaeon]
MKRFLPQLTSRILLFLRQQRNSKEGVLTEDIIKRFHKSKSIISQALSFLAKRGYIKRKYVSHVINHGSRHVISLTAKGLKIAEAIISEGLNPIERKAIEIQ